LTVKIPLNQICVITGISGSGKSTLIVKTLYSFLERLFNEGIKKPKYCKSIDFNLDLINGVELINQNPIGKSSRSNPITYTKGYDDIRKLFSKKN
jgi:Excinuclease ATPase subunit